MVKHVPAKPREPARLQNLAHVAVVSGDLNDSVVSPVSETLAVGGATVHGADWQTLRTQLHTEGQVQSAASAALPPSLTGVTESLGVAGGTLGGVVGLKTVLDGVEAGDKEKVLSGAADVTTSAASLAALGVMGGATILGPAGGVLLSLRALRRLEKKDRTERLNGAGDLLTGSTVVAAALKMPLAATAGFGAAATGLSIVRGLHDIKLGHESGKTSQSSGGLGKLMGAAGLVLLTTGAAAIPGVGLIIAGALLPTMRHVSLLRKVIDPAVRVADRTLYPASVRLEHGVDRLSDFVRPATRPLLRALERVKAFAHPVTAPINHAVSVAADHALAGVRWSIDRVSATRAAQALDTTVGVVTEHLPEWKKPEDPAPPSAVNG